MLALATKNISMLTRLQTGMLAAPGSNLPARHCWESSCSGPARSAVLWWGPGTACSPAGRTSPDCPWASWRTWPMPFDNGVCLETGGLVKQRQGRVGGDGALPGPLQECVSNSPGLSYSLSCSSCPATHGTPVCPSSSWWTSRGQNGFKVLENKKTIITKERCSIRVFGLGILRRLAVWFWALWLHTNFLCPFSLFCLQLGVGFI